MSREDTSMAEGSHAVEEGETVEAVDESLGGETFDATENLDVEDFDFAEFVAGVRPGRRAVTVTMRADLYAEIDKLAAELESGKIGEDRAEEVLAKFREIKQQIVDSQRVFVVEARADYRTEEIIDSMRKSGHVKPKANAPKHLQDAWNVELMLRRLADSIVTPSNVTYEGLVKLREVAESQINLLAGAVVSVNAGESPSAVTPNFSRGR